MTRLGGTLDDAAGEAFDKVARLLDLGFPGGPAIERAAQGGDPARFRFRRGLRHAADHRFDFSFSGLKTAVLHLTHELAAEGVDLQAPQVLADLAASFQQAVVDVLVDKTAAAAQAYAATRSASAAASAPTPACAPPPNSALPTWACPSPSRPLPTAPTTPP